MKRFIHRLCWNPVFKLHFRTWGDRWRTPIVNGKIANGAYGIFSICGLGWFWCFKYTPDGRATVKKGRVVRCKKFGLVKLLPN